MKLDHCETCERPTLAATVRMGHEVRFDPEPALGGSWWPDSSGVMQRYGRLIGKRPGYLPHERSCSDRSPRP